MSTFVGKTGEDIPDEAVVEAYMALRNDSAFKARMSELPSRDVAARQKALEERFAPIAADYGVSALGLLVALGRKMMDPGEGVAPNLEPEAVGPRR